VFQPLAGTGAGASLDAADLGSGCGVQADFIPRLSGALMSPSWRMPPGLVLEVCTACIFSYPEVERLPCKTKVIRDLSIQLSMVGYHADQLELTASDRVFNLKLFFGILMIYSC
jgi:hypothetical protein